jgi:hypothetical protein
MQKFGKEMDELIDKVIRSENETDWAKKWNDEPEFNKVLLFLSFFS